MVAASLPRSARVNFILSSLINENKNKETHEMLFSFYQTLISVAETHEIL